MIKDLGKAIDRAQVATIVGKARRRDQKPLVASPRAKESCPRLAPVRQPSVAGEAQGAAASTEQDGKAAAH